VFNYFFPNFLARVEYERNSGLKFCAHFFGLPHPTFGKNNVGKRCYNFLNFFTIFFGIFFPGSSMNGIRDQNFVFTFSVNLIPFWLKIMPGGGFIIFWIFLLFFSEFSFPGWVWTEFGAKILFLFFGLSHPVLAKNNAGKRFYNFLNFFNIFFGIFLPWLCMNGIRD